LFQSFFIQERYYEKNNSLNIDTSILLLLKQSMGFFLNIDIKNIIVDVDNERFIVIEERMIDNKSMGIPAFELNNDNFEEFSQLIRIITWNDIYKIEKNEIKKVIYADPNVQKMYEDLIKQHLKEEEKKNTENNITLSDIIGAICINENTKYNYKNIGELTIWQLLYQSKSMFDKEYIDITKVQYRSGNFTFDKPPDLNWLNKIKIKLPNIK
jgi:hypothetical protein